MGEDEAEEVVDAAETVLRGGLDELPSTQDVC